MSMRILLLKVEEGVRFYFETLSYKLKSNSCVQSLRVEYDVGQVGVAIGVVF